MDVVSINSLADDQLAAAQAADNGRSSVTIYGRKGASLRQTVVALAQGSALGEHKSPGDASVYCLRGRVRLRSADSEIELGPGDLVAVPPQRHDLTAVEPSVFVLTVALH